MSYFSHTSDTENRDPVLKPILETKEIADLNKEENEIATAIIVSILNSKAFVLTQVAAILIIFQLNAPFFC